MPHSTATLLLCTPSGKSCDMDTIRICYDWISFCSTHYGCFNLKLYFPIQLETYYMFSIFSMLDVIKLYSPPLMNCNFLQVAFLSLAMVILATEKTPESNQSEEKQFVCKRELHTFLDDFEIALKRSCHISIEYSEYWSTCTNNLHYIVNI